MLLPFPETPSLTTCDPLAEFLGAGDGCFTYTFADVVKLSGHACPTVAGAFLLVVRAAAILWPEGNPERGGWRITIHGGEEEGVNGPIGQVFTLLTGAAAANGFRGLGPRFGRKGLLAFAPTATGFRGGFTFQRLATGQAVTLTYAPEVIPPAPGMDDLPRLLAGDPDPVARERFRTAWRNRVLAILADAGRSTIGPISG